MARLPQFLWKTFVGGVFCQFPLTAILVAGWTYRVMQRAAIRRWLKLSGLEEAGLDFESFVARGETTAGMEHSPNWILGDGGFEGARRAARETPGVLRKPGAVIGALTRGLGRNALIGVQGLFNTFVLTLLPGLLWTFGWYAGWDNSFHKGYEQYANGIIISWIGVFLFIAVMFYVPMAQARQAVTGNWRAFYQFRTIWGLVQRRQTKCLLLAGCFSLVSLPLSITKVAPFILGQSTGGQSYTGALNTLTQFYFFASIAGFLAYVGLRLLVTRVYAGAVVEAVREGALAPEALGEFERATLGRLGLLAPEGPKREHLAIKVVKTAVRPAWRFATIVATAIVWFTFVAQIYVSEFLVYHPIRGFMNQSLVQVPWFRYVPGHLQQAAKEERAAHAQAREE
jgi:hypothetical protein